MKCNLREASENEEEGGENEEEGGESVPKEDFKGFPLTKRKRIVESKHMWFIFVLTPVSYTHLTLPTKRIV